MKKMHDLESPVSSILVLAFFSMLAMASFVSVHYDDPTNGPAAISSTDNGSSDVSMVEAGLFGKIWKFVKRVDNCAICGFFGDSEACKRCKGQTSSSSGR